jgi:hypothetical protein
MEIAVDILAQYIDQRAELVGEHRTATAARIEVV